MNFIERIKDLENAYSLEECKIIDNAKLYGINSNPPPMAVHIVFLPTPDNIIKHLSSSYIRKIPEELLLLYRLMNGATFFWSTRTNKRLNLQLPVCHLSIFGIPLCSSRNHIEPFNISLEDLNRPKGTPDSWLKFASFYKPNDYAIMYDLFVDTDSGFVYTVEHNADMCCALDSWPAIDDCLCSIYDFLQSSV